MFNVDLHTHTRFFHGVPSLGRAYDPVGARLLARTAAYRGLDAVVTTNHDYYREFDAGGESFAVLPGIEVTTSRGHALVVGPDPPAQTPEGELTPAETVELAHDRGCAAIIAHPFRNSTVREADADFDAVEVNGKGTDPAEWVEQLAEVRDLPLVGGSDAHYPVEVGRAYTAVEADELTPESLTAAIRDGRVAPRVDRSPSQQLLRRAYKAIHGQKGWLEHPAPEPPGLGTPPGEEENAPPPRDPTVGDSRRS
ncbi:CehA/McbA family metallohydrolase [Halorussus gelatinilyticus]|uniref:CehA/McbA family metallohydrolase n=1 Tax=Halorussus gelatinilyticus TaxID=2937524 RepID=A0A8U0II84_9EURY|nr:CehA/McbA family metallohydrolase [Halorussus gelatinilyticus]UPW00810.1 CehA/McbA family metallohydrolase [Halorussus gelatinilyticus]